MYYKSFVNNLNSLIDANRISPTQLAREIGISPASMFRYLKNERTPDINCIVNIATYFKVSIDWLLGLSETSNSEITEFAALFSVASADDRAVISAILDKYHNREI